MANKFWETKIITSNGKYIHLCREDENSNWKIHKWDGPAIYPIDGSGKKNYYLYGIEYTRDEFDMAVKDREGIPFHKTAAGIRGMRMQEE